VANTTEAQLARDLLSGDMEAFDRFVETYRSKIFQYSYMMCGQREDAEEVAQETLLKVFQSMDQLREPERLKAWVFTIARNACYMKRRKSVFAPQHELSLEELLPVTSGDGSERRIQIADWGALPDTEVLRKELREELDRAIGELPDIYRSVIMLRDIEELSTEEAAEVLGVSIEVIKTRLHRARLSLRQKLDEYLRGAAKN
jgi:RNA polymerase sigma-70 factor (ECF subfamily)